MWDHFTCLLTLHGLPERSEKQEKVEAKWNLAKVGGWSRYKELTDDELSEKLDKVVTNENTTIEEKIDKFDKGWSQKKKIDKIKTLAE